MKTVPLADCVSLIRGITFKPSQKCELTDPGAVACFRTANVQAELDESDVIAVPEDIVTNPDKMVRAGDILVSSANSWNLVGKCCRIKTLEYKATAGGFISILRPTNHGVDPGYLYYWFSSGPIQHKVRSFGNQTTNISNLNHSRTLGLPFPLPPLSEQKRIAAILDAADALRAKRRESIAQLDTLLQATFLDMFGDPVTNPNGWEKPVLESFCRPKQWPTIGKADLTDFGYPVFGANGRIGFYSDYNHADPTVLITCRGATCGTINVCDPMSYVTGNAMALNNLDPERVELRYLEHALTATDFAAVITGVAQPQITRQSLKLLSVPLPPLHLQRRFATIVESVDQQKFRMRAHLAELDTLFASLQSRAFSGQL